jgi:hypothetical protein
MRIPETRNASMDRQASRAADFSPSGSSCNWATLDIYVIVAPVLPNPVAAPNPLLPEIGWRWTDRLVF